MYKKYITLLLLLPCLLGFKDDSPNVNRIKIQQRTIYLSFDDGPFKGSRSIDQIACDEGVKVNVFVLGINVLSSHKWAESYTQYRNNPYVEFSNGSFSMNYFQSRRFYKYPAYIFTEFSYNQDLFGLGNNICRVPGVNMWRVGGKRSNKGFTGRYPANLLEAVGYVVVGWDVEWKYDEELNVTGRSGADMVREIETALDKDKTFTPGHLVLLCHDEMFSYPWEKDQLKLLIETLKAKGNYKFEWLSNYPGCAPPRFQESNQPLAN